MGFTASCSNRVRIDSRGGMATNGTDITAVREVNGVPEPKWFYEDQFCSEGFAVTKNCAAARFWTSNLFARLIVTAVF